MTNRRARRARRADSGRLLPVLALAALIGASCGPGDGAVAPPQGDTEVRVVIDGPGRLFVDGYACDDGCPVQVDGGTEVTFEAAPASGNVLVAWGGVCEPLAPTCTRTFHDGDEVRATFAPHALRIDMTGDGVGTIEIAGPTVDATCARDCGVAFSESLSHLLSIEPSGRTELGAWSDACEDAGRPDYCYVRPSGATDVGKTWTHPPLAEDDSYTATGVGALVVAAADGVLANDDDTTDDVLTAVVAEAPSHGTLELAADGGFAYAPRDGYLGPDTFRYTVRDAFGSEDGAEVAIEVINRAPVARVDRYETVRNASITVAAPGVLTNDVDPDGDALSAAVVADVEHGSLTLRPDGGFDYEPAPGFAGNDRFTYQATDGVLSSAVTTVTIAVAATNRAPTAAPDAYEVSRGAALSVAAPGVLANDDDADGDALTAVLVPGSGPATGTLDFASDGGFTYVPDGSYVGPVQFQYRADDGQDLSDPATVTIDVTNGAPMVADDPAGGGRYETEANERLDVAAPGLLVNDADPDGDDLTAEVDTAPAHGRVNLNDAGGFTYTPDRDYDGLDSFTYVASDGDLDSDPGTVSIRVTDDDDDD